MSSPVVYDKAKYHFESVENEGLPEIHAYIHTGMYLGWLIENDLIDKEFIDDFGEAISEFTKKKITSSELFEIWDGVLADDMLTEEGNCFTVFYFDFENGKYVHDYEELLVKELPSMFHVKDTWENYELMKVFVGKAFVEWKKQTSKQWWEFWK